MADDKNTEHFVLGLIVAVIFYLVFRREWAALSKGRGGSGANGAAGAAGAGGAGGSGGCGCGGSNPTGAPAGTVPISIGGQSYGGSSGYSGSSVGGFTEVA